MDLSDIQGLVFYGYRRQAFARYYRCTFEAEAEPRAWLSRILHRVSSAHRRERHERTRLNLAFTASGLARLGLDEASLSGFPREFTQGMSHPERSLALGDVAENAPEQWEFGGARGPRLDALVMLFCESKASLKTAHAEVAAQLERHGIAWSSMDAYLPEDGREHFGFANALTNPVVKGGPVKRDKKNPFEKPVARGELLLGYTNGYGRLPSSPMVPPKPATRELPRRVHGGKALDFGYNGTFLVMRKLEQDVDGFWDWAARAASTVTTAGTPMSAEELAAKMMGRWPDGRPLALTTDPHDSSVHLNAFGYRDDPRGLRCPLGAHVRRANPRDSLGDDPRVSLERSSRHRIMRRGRLYVEPRAEGGKARGLIFIGLNANLRRQFEFIQQTWLNGKKFAGLSSEQDPLLGRSGLGLDGARDARLFTLPSEPVRRRVMGLPNFVRLRGGGYFFLPSLRALAYLAEDG